MNANHPAGAIARPLFGIGSAYAESMPATASASASASAAPVVSVVIGARHLFTVTDIDIDTDKDIPTIPLHRLGLSDVADEVPYMRAPLSTIAELEGEDSLSVSNRANNRHFWAPNDSWRSITPLASQQDILRLRATNKTIYAQADQAITAMTLQPRHLEAFINSPGFRHVKTLCIEYADNESLLRLVTHLKAHPRHGLTLQLSSDALASPTASRPRRKQISADMMARLIDLPLAALHIDRILGFNSIDTLDALAACPFPVDLQGAFSRESLMAASRIAELRTLSIYGMEFDDELANVFSTHPKLQSITVGASRDVSSDRIAALAPIPTLRSLSVHDWTDTTLIDEKAANAIAANPMRETLKIDETY